MLDGALHLFPAAGGGRAWGEIEGRRCVPLKLVPVGKGVCRSGCRLTIWKRNSEEAVFCLPQVAGDAVSEGVKISFEISRCNVRDAPLSGALFGRDGVSCAICLPE